MSSVSRFREILLVMSLCPCAARSICPVIIMRARKKSIYQQYWTLRVGQVLQNLFFHGNAAQALLRSNNQFSLRAWRLGEIKVYNDIFSGK